MRRKINVAEVDNRAEVAKRQAASREARAKAGGKQVTAFLTPKAAAKLELWQARGDSIAAVINRLLERSRP